VIVCTKCGFRNADSESFCSSCGSFLEWTGERVEAPAPPPRAEEPTSRGTAPPPGGLIDRARELLGQGPAGEQDSGASIADRERGGAREETPVTVESGGASAVPPTTLGPIPRADVPPPMGETAPQGDVPSATSAPPRNADAIAEVATPGVGGEATAEPAPGPTDGVTTERAGRASAPTAQPPAVQPSATRPSPAPAPSEAIPTAPGPRVARELGQPGLVKPAAPKPRPAVGVEPTEEAPGPGDVICPDCGRGNVAGRRFCRRCGASLVAAPSAQSRREPWWRRMFRRQREPVAAGTRPTSVQRHAADAATGGRGIGSRVARVLVIVVLGVAVGCVLGYLVIPGFREVIDDAVKQVTMAISPSIVDVRPSVELARGEVLPAHPAHNAFDGDRDSYWAAIPGAASPSITAAFASPVAVAKVLVSSGTPARVDTQPRPNSIQIDFLDVQDTSVFTRKYDLLDTRKEQVLDVEVSNSSAFRITVLTVHGSPTGSVAITEIAFQGRS